MLHLIFPESADPSLGRLDYASLPQQALMEMVIAEITNKERICGGPSESKDIEEWYGVTTDGEEVVGIEWGSLDLEGSLRLKWLPSTVKEFGIYDNNFTGTISFASLPPHMTTLGVSNNAFTGDIDLQNLPATLEDLSVSHNKFMGSLKLESLPQSVTRFSACENMFFGCVDLTRLPAAITHIDLSKNHLSGSVIMTQLPITLISLYLQYNEFNGPLDMTQLPISLEVLHLDHNLFTDYLDLTSLPVNMTDLCLNNNSFCCSSQLQHRPSDCEESVRHLLFDCPRLATLRLKYDIHPSGDGPWFARRVAEFLVEVLKLLPSVGYECPLPENLSTDTSAGCRSVTKTTTREKRPSELSLLLEADDRKRIKSLCEQKAS